MANQVKVTATVKVAKWLRPVLLTLVWLRLPISPETVDWIVGRALTVRLTEPTEYLKHADS